MKKYNLLYIALLWILTDQVFAENTLVVGNFSKQNITSITPKNWHPLNFASIENKTAYFLTRDNNKVIFKAVSHASASGYIHKISIDPEEYPILNWQWKISNIIDTANINTRNGDDYPARLYIMFEYDVNRLIGEERFKADIYKNTYGKYPPLAVLNYVWDNKQPIGYTTQNAYSSRVQMFVVQSGKSHVGTWVKQQVNIYNDYKRAFGEAPTKIIAIAIMTDTDNTGESATAYYGDIKFQKSLKLKIKNSQNRKDYHH